MPSRLEFFKEMSPTKVSRQINQEVPHKDSQIEERREMNTNGGHVEQKLKEDDNMEVNNENFQEKEEEHDPKEHKEEEEEDVEKQEEEEDEDEDEGDEEDEEDEEEDKVEGSDDSDQNSVHTEEEEDQFDQESEVSESITDDQALPFWFAHEDEDHIKEIFNFYSNHIKIEEAPIEANNRRCSPQSFVGSVKRTALRNCGDFMTLDEVRTYKKLAAPPGVPMPIDQKFLLLTSWNEEGLPWQMSSVTLSMKTFWSQRAVAVSYLIRFPSLSQRDEDVFTVAQADLEVTFCQNCKTQLCYEPYLTDFKNDSYFLENLPYQLENFQLELCPY